MSSHREAPEISKDPVADNTDVYAFVSPDSPGTVTLISNFVPLQDPPGGPNFFEFGDDVLYEIHIDNDGDADVDITYEFRFNTVVGGGRSGGRRIWAPGCPWAWSVPSTGRGGKQREGLLRNRQLT